MSENEIKTVAWVDLDTWIATNDAGDSFFTDYQDEDTVAVYDQSAIDRLTAERADALAAVSSKAGWEWKKRAEQAEAERDAAVADAERYRWLRTKFRVSSLDMSGQHGYAPNGEVGRIKGPSLDAAIDAARSEGGV